MNTYPARARLYRLALLLLFTGFCPVKGWSQTEAKVRLQHPQATIIDVLTFYQDLTGRRVYLALGVNATVTLIADDPLPRAAAAELIRKTLLESCGVELRDSEDNVTLAGWSQDPKYPHRETGREALPSMVPGNGLPVRNFRPPNVKPRPTPQ